VSFVDLGAHSRQAFGNGREFEIGAADLVAQIQQDFGNPTHADAANARKMKMLGTEKHFLYVLFSTGNATVN
jgi:hypothetical protein